MAFNLGYMDDEYNRIRDREKYRNNKLKLWSNINEFSRFMSIFNMVIMFGLMILNYKWFIDLININISLNN